MHFFRWSRKFNFSEMTDKNQVPKTAQQVGQLSDGSHINVDRNFTNMDITHVSRSNVNSSNINQNYVYNSVEKCEEGNVKIE